ncbi:chemotaxis protein CheW [candidate division KSB1 bacterium]
MEILFFRIANRIAAIETGNIQEVLHNKDTIPFLPISRYVKKMVVNRGKVIGVIDLGTLFSLPDKPRSLQEYILMSCSGISFCLATKKILVVRRLSKKFIKPAVSGLFIPEKFIGNVCVIGQKTYPILSEKKILEYPDIKVLWSKENSVEL